MEKSNRDVMKYLRLLRELCSATEIFADQHQVESLLKKHGFTNALFVPLVKPGILRLDKLPEEAHRPEKPIERTYLLSWNTQAPDLELACLFVEQIEKYCGKKYLHCNSPIPTDRRSDSTFLRKMMNCLRQYFERRVK